MSAKEFLATAGPLPEPMLLVDAGGEIQAANAAAGTLLRIAPAALAGKALTELSAGSDGEVTGFLARCARSRQLLPGKLTLLAGDDELTLRADGAVYKPRQDGEGALVLLRLRDQHEATRRFDLLNERIAELHREIAHRRQVERELAEQHEWVAVTLASIADAVIATDAEGRVQLMNPVAEELTGWSVDEARGKWVEEIFRTRDQGTRKKQRVPVEEVLGNGTTLGVSNHTLLVARDGREIPIDHSAAPIRGPEGKILGMVTVFRDVSERYEAERGREQVLAREHAARVKAEAADRTKDEFLATLSHELRAPLQAIANWVYLLKSERLDTAATANALDTIDRNLQVQTQLIDDLLDISHMAAGQVHVNHKRLELAPLVDEACTGLREAIKDKGIQLDCSLATGLTVEGDEERLRQVISNLVSNALKFTPGGGVIEVRLESAGDRARITVQDSGEGIGSEFLPHVFKRFRQADASRTRLHGGLGLGLAIARHLVELHGGTLDAESPGAGRGATFTVELPRLPAADPAGDANDVVPCDDNAAS